MQSRMGQDKVGQTQPRTRSHDSHPSPYFGISDAVWPAETTGKRHRGKEAVHAFAALLLDFKSDLLLQEDPAC